MPLTRRRATPADIPRLVEMGARFWGTLDVPFAFNPKGFGEQLAVYIAYKQAFVQVLVDDKDAPVGAIGGFYDVHPLNRSPKMASELFWWVEPEHRGSKAAIGLLTDYEKWAEGEGCGIVTFSMFLGPDNRMQRLLEKRGFRHIESAFGRFVEA